MDAYGRFGEHERSLENTREHEKKNTDLGNVHG